MTQTKDTPWLIEHRKRSAKALEVMRKAYQEVIKALVADGASESDARIAAHNALTKLYNETR